MQTQTKKSTRLDLRIEPEIKKLLEKAAKRKGLSLSSYVKSTAIKDAQEIEEQSILLRLSKQDSELFLSALGNPPEPSEVLKSAFANYQENS